VNKEGAVVDNGKEAVSNSVEELIDTVKTRIQTIRDTPGVTKVNYGTARIFKTHRLFETD
jgi:hypothetical protein